MGIFGIAGGANAPSPAISEDARGILVLKKQQDVAKAQAQALIDLITQATSGDTGRYISVYA